MGGKADIIKGELFDFSIAEIILRQILLARRSSFYLTLKVYWAWLYGSFSFKVPSFIGIPFAPFYTLVKKESRYCKSYFTKNKVRVRVRKLRNKGTWEKLLSWIPLIPEVWCLQSFANVCMKSSEMKAL